MGEEGGVAYVGVGGGRGGGGGGRRRRRKALKIKGVKGRVWKIQSRHKTGFSLLEIFIIAFSEHDCQ